MLTAFFRLTLSYILLFLITYFCAHSQVLDQGVIEGATALNSVSENTSDEHKEAERKQKEDIIKRTGNASNIESSLTKRELFIGNGRNTFKFKYSGRIQTRFDVSKSSENESDMNHELYFRRVRFKSDGHLFSPKFGYKLEIDIVGAQVLDAFLKYSFYKNLQFWAGQTKLRGNRERVISSQNLQFVDRSLLNRQFTLDRDIGVWFFNHFNAGNGILRQIVSVSKGEGRSIWKENPQKIERGLDYTARLEYLPFGGFKNNGDYVGSDIDREPMPKLSLGLTFDYNQNAVKCRGQKGSIAGREANLRSWMADLMFKYRGFSVMSEFVDRVVYNYKDQTPEQYTDFLNDFYTGQAFNIQSGYVLQSNYEFAARYTVVRPQENYVYNDLTEYTFAFSKFIVGHKIKAQTDFSILQEEGKPVTHTYRLQFEISL